MRSSVRPIQPQRGHIFIALALVAMFIFSACQSDTSAERVDSDQVTPTEPDLTQPQDRVEEEALATDPIPDSGLSTGEEDLESALSAPLYEAQRDVMAPDFSLPTLGGETFRLSEHQGRVIVINFWATWCPPCLKEIPEFIELQEELGKDGLQFVGISLDEEGFDIVRPFAQEYNFNYPVVVDDGTTAEKYGPIASMPTTFIVSRDGRVRRYAPGMLTKSVLRPVLVELLNEKA